MAEASEYDHHGDEAECEHGEYENECQQQYDVVGVVMTRRRYFPRR